MILSLLFMVLVKCLVGPVIYFLMVVILGAGGFGIYFTFTKWQHFQNNPLEISTYWQMSSTWKNIFIILCVTTGILFLLFIFIISRVRVAVAVIGEASKAVWSILSSL